MSSLNQVNLIGRVGQDPEVKYLPGGDAVANVSLATSERWKDKATGEQKESTEWHRLTFYGKLAEVVGNYVKKGSQIYVCGSNKTRKWQKDGVDMYTTEVKVSQMTMLGGKTDGANTQGRDTNNGAQHHQQPQGQRPAAAAARGALDDDIPF